MQKITYIVCVATIVFTALVGVPVVAADDLVRQLKTGGHVLMIRHAYAPGTGDPDHFRIDDCTTQRNLDEQGRQQARAIGRWLQRHALTSARIYSSQWCRCLETARLLGLGPVYQLPALNSFFDRPQDREPNLSALRAFLTQQPTDGPLLVLVTHYVTIAGITGLSVSSGEAVAMRLNDGGETAVLGRLQF
jgi:phosphohistidine phosphatase SixA